MGNFSEEIKSTFANDKIKAMLNVLYTANWISSKQNEFFKNYDLSPQQYNVLRILRGAGGPLPVQTIKDRMIERAPNATRLMDKLYAKGWIDRLPCPDDRRVVHITIMNSGLKLLETIGTDHQMDLLENLTTSEARTLNELLDKIR